MSEVELTRRSRDAMSASRSKILPLSTVPPPGLHHCRIQMFESDDLSAQMLARLWKTMELVFIDPDGKAVAKVILNEADEAVSDAGSWAQEWVVYRTLPKDALLIML